MRDASLSSTKTWPRIFAAEPHASVLRWGPADSWHPRSASSRAAGGGGIRGRRPGRGHTRRRCRLRDRSARRGRDEPSRSITGPRTGDVSGHGRGVERCSTSERRLDHRDDPEGSGRSPRAFALSAGPWATRPRQPLQESRQPPPSARLTHSAPACHPSRPASSNVGAARQRRGLGASPRPGRLAGPRLRRPRPSPPPRSGSR